MSACVVTTPPAVENHAVVFSVVHSDSGRVFRCELSDFDDVRVTSVPRDMAPWADGKIRAEVARVARQHAAENRELFEELFDQAGVASSRPQQVQPDARD